jgi:hypothetical protein
VSVTLDGQTLFGYSFNAATVDGNFGLLATGAKASFDNVRVKTNDMAFAAGGGASLISAASSGAISGATLTQSELDAIATVAISQWSEALGDGDARLAALGDVRFGIADLAGSELGYAEGNTILVDVDAAGSGWFVDTSPASSSEFRVRLDRNVFGSAPDSEAYGHMDLVTVVEHEIGHLLGFDHADAGAFAVMHEELDAGVRYLLASGSTAPAAETPAAAPAFDAYADWGGVGASAGIDWQAESKGGWEVKLSPYDTGKPARGTSNITPFEVDLLAKYGAAKQGGEFDSMGRELLGKDG